VVPKTAWTVNLLSTSDSYLTRSEVLGVRLPDRGTSASDGFVPPLGRTFDNSTEKQKHVARSSLDRTDDKSEGHEYHRRATTMRA